MYIGTGEELSTIWPMAERYKGLRFLIPTVALLRSF